MSLIGLWKKLTISLVTVVLLTDGSLFGSGLREDPYQEARIHVSLELEFDPTSLEFLTVDGYHAITADGFSMPMSSGEAALPARYIDILVPHDAENIVISIPEMDLEMIPFEGEIMGVPSPYPVSQGGETVSHVAESTPDMVIEFMDDGFVRGCRILTYRFNPVMPADGALMVVTRMEVLLSFTGTEEDREEGRESSAFDTILSNSVENPQDMSRFSRSKFDPTGILKDDDVQYVIVTDTTYVGDAFRPLEEWKTRKGVPSRIVEMSFVMANYNGTDNAEKLRNFIRDAVASWDTEYVLLGGDIALVPYRACYGYVSSGSGPSEEKYIATDLYYSDLDGTYNADGDAIWGEVADNVDLHPDVIVGRAPVQTESQADAFVSKVLTYEIEPGAGYLLNATMAGEYLDSTSNSSKGNDRIVNDLLPSAYNVTSLCDKGFRQAGSLSKNSFINSLNLGAGLTFHSGHSNHNSMSMGSPYGGSYILYNGDVYNYDTDAGTGVLSSIGCTTTRFEVNDCIAEKHVLEPDGGAVAYIGNSRYGWYAPGMPGYGASAQFQYIIAEELFKKDIPRLGDHFASGKNRFVGYSSNDGSARWIQYALNLLGDPEMAVRTVEPEPLNVTYDPIAGTSNVELNISVRNGSGSPVDGALVCLHQAGFYSYGLTGPEGYVDFLFSTNRTEPVNLTVTAGGFLPFMANITVDPIPPEIWFLETPEATTGDLLLITCYASDDLGVRSVQVEYRQGGPDGNISGVVNLTGNATLWSGYILVQATSMEPVHMVGMAVDRPGNINWTSELWVEVEDNDPPELIADSTLKTGFTGGDMGFGCSVRDNIAPEGVLLSWQYEGSPSWEYVPMASPDLTNWSAETKLAFDNTAPILYTYDIVDVNGNHNITDTGRITILDDDLPTILSDHSDGIGTTSDEMHFSFETSDNIGIEASFLEWWYGDEGLKMNSSLTLQENGSYEHVITIPADQDSEIVYEVHVVDLSGNWNHSSRREVDLIDDDRPQFHRDLTDRESVTGGYMTFSIEASDNIMIDRITVTHWQGEGKERITTPMKKDADGTWKHVIEVRRDCDLPISYHFTASDLERNENRSATGSVTINDMEDPRIIFDSSDTHTSMGGTFNFSVEVADNIGIEDVEVEWWWGGEGYRYLVPLHLTGVDMWSTTFSLDEKRYPFLNYRVIVEDLNGNIMEGNLMEVTIFLPPPVYEDPPVDDDGDIDDDMMPDEWEEAMGLVVGEDDRFEDPDGDGYVNLQEFENGTDPMDPKSHPQTEVNENAPSIFALLGGATLIIMLVIIMIIFFLLKSREEEKRRRMHHLDTHHHKGQQLGSHHKAPHLDQHPAGGHGHHDPPPAAKEDGEL